MWLIKSNRWFSLGGLIASTVLKARADADPYDYKTSIYIQFGIDWDQHHHLRLLARDTVYVLSPRNAASVD